MLILNLMSPSELEETIELLKNKLSETAIEYGLSDNRTIEIYQSLELYQSRLNELKPVKC